MLTFSESLKSVLLEEAPTIAQDWISVVKPIAIKTLEKFPTLRGDAWDGFYFDRQLTMQQCEVVSHRVFSLSEERLTKNANIYANDTCLAWFHKLQAKLFNVTDMTMKRTGQGEYRFIGNLGDKKVVVDQIRILKSSKNGKLFHQFPARIYVDGKFYSEANFKKEFQC